jgi:uncharacterized protein YlzI (FlbEa/FlbD family)
MFIKLTERTGVVFYVNTSHIVKIKSLELSDDYIVFLVLSTGKSVAVKESLEDVLNLINK